jgi:hypothetical protein
MTAGGSLFVFILEDRDVCTFEKHGCHLLHTLGLGRSSPRQKLLGRILPRPLAQSDAPGRYDSVRELFKIRQIPHSAQLPSPSDTPLYKPPQDAACVALYDSS